MLRGGVPLVVFVVGIQADFVDIFFIYSVAHAIGVVGRQCGALGQDRLCDQCGREEVVDHVSPWDHVFKVIYTGAGIGQ